MARPNPLITVCLGVGVLALGVEMTAIYRSRHRAPAATSAAAPEEPEPVAAAPSPPAPIVPPPSPPSPPPAVAPPPAPTAGAPTGEAPAALPQFVSPNIETVIRIADEEAFEKLEIPEATRAAIRRLNDEHQQKLRALRAGEAGVTSEQQLTGNNANVVVFTQTRREGLQEILGADTEIRFERAERAATKHLHHQLRAEALGGVSAPTVTPSAPGGVSAPTVTPSAP